MIFIPDALVSFWTTPHRSTSSQHTHTHTRTLHVHVTSDCCDYSFCYVIIKIKFQVQLSSIFFFSFRQILRYFHRQRALGRRSARSPRLATRPYAESNRDNAASTVTRVPADLQPQICDSPFKSFHSEEAAKLDKGTSSGSEWKMKTALNGWEILHFTSRQRLHV